MTETELHDRPATERGVLIVINEVEYTTQRREMTGRELMTLADIPDGNHLFLGGKAGKVGLGADGGKGPQIDCGTVGFIGVGHGPSGSEGLG